MICLVSYLGHRLCWWLVSYLHSRSLCLSTPSLKHPRKILNKVGHVLFSEQPVGQHHKTQDEPRDLGEKINKASLKKK